MNSKKAFLAGKKKKIKIFFPFDKTTITWVKEIPGRQYINKYWTVPLLAYNCKILEEKGFFLSEKLTKWKEKNKNPKPIKLLSFGHLDSIMRNYQKEGASFFVNQKGRALNGDDMGLGKTIQSLAYLLYNNEYPVIILCNATGKYTWEDEVVKWLNVKPALLEGNYKKTKPIEESIIILNYDILDSWKKYLVSLKPQLIIMDEIHLIKNSNTKKYKATKYLCNKAKIKKRIGLSGTLVDNSPLDIYNGLRLIKPQLFPSSFLFKQRYCGPKHNGFGWTYKGSSNEEELYEILRNNVLIRRLKENVLSELPNKIFNFVPLRIDNKQEYEKALNNFRTYLQKSLEIEIRETIHKYFSEDYPVEINDFKLQKLKEEVNDSPMNQIIKLKELAVKGKFKETLLWVENFLKASNGKLVIFCERTFVIDDLMKHFKGIAVKIDGSVPTKKRREIIKQFTSSKKIRIFIGNSAAEVNINLTAASDVAIIEYPWTPGRLNQRIDRLHRFGQKKTVNVYYLMAMNTIEIELVKLLDKKMKTIKKILDGKKGKDIDLIMNLIKKIKI